MKGTSLGPVISADVNAIRCLRGKRRKKYFAVVIQNRINLGTLRSIINGLLLDFVGQSTLLT